MKPKLSPFVFVIDTDHYAGNWQRELTAFLTGQYGECGVGDELALTFHAEQPEMDAMFEQIVDHQPDGHGCVRPCTVWETPGFFNDGMGNAYTATDAPDLVAKRYQDSSESYWGAAIARAEEAIAQGNDAWERDLATYREALAAAKAKGPEKLAAHQSVGIYFNEKPATEILDFMKQRSALFFDQLQGWTVNVLGFRVIEVVVVETETAV